MFPELTDEQIELVVDALASAGRSPSRSRLSLKAAAMMRSSRSE